MKHPLSRFASSPFKGDAASAAGRPLRGGPGLGLGANANPLTLQIPVFF